MDELKTQARINELERIAEAWEEIANTLAWQLMDFILATSRLATGQSELLGDPMSAIKELLKEQGIDLDSEKGEGER